MSSSSKFECNLSYCRIGFTCRCPSGRLFGTPFTPGGQAQYIRVPKAGGTLYSLSSAGDFWSTSEVKGNIADSSLLLMCDILPTGVFTAFRALNHPNVLPMVTGLPYPLSSKLGDGLSSHLNQNLDAADCLLTIGVIGLGPVGICACVSLLEMLSSQKLAFKMVGVDLVEARREKMRVVYDTIDQVGKGSGEFVTASVDESKEIVRKWTNDVGCNVILEVSIVDIYYEVIWQLMQWSRWWAIIAHSHWGTNSSVRLDPSYPLECTANLRCHSKAANYTQKIFLLILAAVPSVQCFQWR